MAKKRTERYEIQHTRTHRTIANTIKFLYRTEAEHLT